MMTLVRDRLRGVAMPPFRLVETAAEFAALEAPPPAARLPAAYVVPLGSRPGPNNLAAGGFRQRVQETVGVVIFTGNLRDPLGGAAAADIGSLRASVRTALVGWTPAAGWEPVELGNGQMIDMSEGVLAWQETFSAAFQLRAS